MIPKIQSVETRKGSEGQWAKRSIVVSENKQRLKRAEVCTETLKTFEKSCKDWADLAVVLVEVEKDELFLDLGYASIDEWFDKVAPVSKRLCYAVKGRYKALLEAGLDHDTMKQLPAQTAQWASKAKNISPAELTKPEVIEALKLPKQKAVKLLKHSLPDQHIEEVFEVACKFAETQGQFVQKVYETFKRMPEHANDSFEDFVEWMASEVVLTLAADIR